MKSGGQKYKYCCLPKCAALHTRRLTALHTPAINLHERTALTIEENASSVNLDRAKPTNRIKYTFNLQT
jgi:hypothetical protein